jgi:hypothetical protein
MHVDVFEISYGSKCAWTVCELELILVILEKYFSSGAKNTNHLHNIIAFVSGEESRTLFFIY